MKDKPGLADFLLEKNILSYDKYLTKPQIAELSGMSRPQVGSAISTLESLNMVTKEFCNVTSSYKYKRCRIHWIWAKKISNQPARIFGAANWG